METTTQVQEKVPLSRAEEQLGKIVALFQSGAVSGLLSKVVIDSPEKPSSKWSFGNQLLMLIHGTTDARGFRQWQSVNRYVKKGSRAFYILGPIIRKKEVDDEVTHEKKLVPFLSGFKAIPVFAVEETDGQDLPVYKPIDPPPLLDVAEKFGYKVQYEKVAGVYASTSYGSKTITLGSEAWDVFFHELMHVVHRSFEPKSPDHVGQETEAEAIAQLGAAVLARVYGRPADAFAYGYIAS
jgi:hypothetical protein